MALEYAHAMSRVTATSQHKELSGWETALSGAMARIVAQSLLHPLDVVRTRTQAVGVPSRGPGVITYGLAPQVLLSGPAGAVQFLAADGIRNELTQRLPEVSESALGRAMIQMVAAACGTALAASVRVPQELIKQGCMAELYPNAAVAVSEIWKRGGLFAFYKGARSTMIRDVLWNSLSFTFFRMLSEGKKDGQQQGASAQYVNGILAGSLAALLTHPLDVLKTRVMTSRGAVSTSSLFSQLSSMVSKEGPGVLLKGILPRLFYLGPLASLVFATNEIILSQMRKNYESVPLSSTDREIQKKLETRGGGATIPKADHDPIGCFEDFVLSST